MALVPLRRPALPAVPAAPVPGPAPREGAKRRLCEYILGVAAARGEETTAGAAALFSAIHAAGALPADVLRSLDLLRPTRPGTCPDRATLYRWLDAYRAWRAGEAGALADGRRGRLRSVYGWEARALHLWQGGAKRAAASIARQLVEEGEPSATEARVRAFLRTVPSDVSQKGRLGPQLHRDQQGLYVRRTTEHVRPGDVYVGDGHTLDVYLEHPAGRRPWRAELTAWLDVRSRRVVGWWVSEAESAYATLFALSHAVASQGLAGHVPAMVHIDNGSGYVAQLHTAEATGLLGRLGIEAMRARPRNARAKPIERFFRTLEEDFGKRWVSYCGPDADPETLKTLLARHKRGEIRLPTVQQWMDGFRHWLSHSYHAAPHPELPGLSRQAVWDAEFVPSPPTGDLRTLMWPRVQRVVNRGTVMVDGREYVDRALRGHNRTELHDGQVQVEIDIHDDRHVRVLTLDGRWICDAALVAARDYVPRSRLVDAQAKRLAAQTRRLEAHLQEVQDRAALTVDADQRLEALDAITGEVTDAALEMDQGGRLGLAPEAPEDELPRLDLWGE